MFGVNVNDYRFSYVDYTINDRKSKMSDLMILTLEDAKKGNYYFKLPK